MESQGLLEALAKEAQEERQTLLAQAQAEAQEIIEKAHKEARELKGQRMTAAKSEVSSERLRILGGASLKAADLILRTKEMSLAKAFEEAKAELVKRFEGKEGAKNLAALAEEALSDLEEPFILEVHPKDTSTAQGYVRERKLRAEVKGNPALQHGVRFLSGDGKLVILNTLSSRLERAGTSLRVEIGKLLFSP